MPIRLYNTKTRQKEVFEPLDAKNVRMYVCGPTVYDRAHIGNARPVVVFDTLYRLLRHEYGADHVQYARNFTDVDDKINAKAVETGRSIRDITDETINWYLSDMGALGNIEPDLAPRATEYIPQMIEMIEELIAKGHAYEAEGHALFAVESYEKYGALSGRSIDDMIAGARVELAPYKRNPMDFVLWKPSSDDQPGWDSPWGRGRPGWHIECSAMARALFGERFDIHGGGIDLQFPHHENEIAQSCACCGDDSFASVWMHNEMLQVEGKKMSKSLGNFFSVRDLLDRGYPGEVIRFVYLSTHYSKPMDWTVEKASAAKTHLDHWYAFVGDVEAYTDPAEIDLAVNEMGIIQNLKDDLNTNGAIHSLYKSLDLFGGGDDVVKKRKFKTAANILGLLDKTGTQWILETAVGYDLANVIQRIVEKLDKAREEKDFASADFIRAGLAAGRVKVMSAKDGSNWSIEPYFGSIEFDLFPDEAVSQKLKCGIDQSPAQFLVRLLDRIVK